MSTAEFNDVPEIRNNKSKRRIIVDGHPDNIRRHGSCIARRNEVFVRYVFSPTFRSQIPQILLFLFSSLLCIELSDRFPILVLPGELIPFQDSRLILYFPILWLIPLYFCGRIFFRLYDQRYHIDARGVEAKVGLLSLQLRQPRLRFEDIRGVEPIQTISQRILNIGDLLIGSAMTEDVEIIMQGIADPVTVQKFLSGEIERRLESLNTVSPANKVAVLNND